MNTISVEVERHLVAEAQNGSQQAMVDLLDAYQPMIGGTANKMRGVLDFEDAHQYAAEKFIEMIMDHDYEKSARLASRKRELEHRLKDAASAEDAWTIPPRTKQRFMAILKKAEYDPAVGADLAPQYEMPRRTFVDLYNRLYGQVEYDDTFEVQAQPVVDADSRLLVELAFKALDDTEARIVELAYGFTTAEPVPDAEIAYRLGTNRTKIQRMRAKALEDMRERIGAA
jgi:DNA-directed RNA polymerase specialized sigma subunit